MSVQRLKDLLDETEELVISGKPERAEALVGEIEKLAQAHPGAVSDRKLIYIYTMIEQACLPRDERDKDWRWLP